MLHEFLTANREELIERCRAKVKQRLAPRPDEPELQKGIPLFLEQLIRILRLEQASSPAEHRKISDSKEPDTTGSSSEIGKTAASHGQDLLKQGFTVEQVVHDYGDLCQAVTELAVQQHAPIAMEEFRTLNLCLDNAIAGAVTAYGRQRDQRASAVANERLGFLAHELRNLLNSAMLAVSAVKSGTVGLSGATGAVLDRSLLGLRALIDRSLAEVRLNAGIPASLCGSRFRSSLKRFRSRPYWGPGQRPGAHLLAGRSGPVGGRRPAHAVGGGCQPASERIQVHQAPQFLLQVVLILRSLRTFTPALCCADPLSERIRVSSARLSAMQALVYLGPGKQTNTCTRTAPPAAGCSATVSAARRLGE